MPYTLPPVIEKLEWHKEEGGRLSAHVETSDQQSEIMERLQKDFHMAPQKGPEGTDREKLYSVLLTRPHDVSSLLRLGAQVVEQDSGNMKQAWQNFRGR